ncbi:MAG TPA: IS630 family transposase [Tepidisphaeraceae bacterium]|nr:IS630 family transposase [Tepidisphaeraceae bacterium]
MGAWPDRAPPHDGVPRAAPAATPRHAQARRAGLAPAARVDPRPARHDAGRAGRRDGQQGQRADDLAGDAEARPAAQKKTRHASEQDRPDVRQRRDHWFEQFAGVTLAQFVFIDEFGATTSMTRAYARGPRGQRVVCKSPHGHWKILSTIAAMTAEGMLAGASFDGATDTETFVTFVREFLLPHLRPGQVVVMDNLPAHKSPRVDELIESAGARVLRLPPYSPDYNPIEMAISKVKSILRAAGARAVESLLDAIGRALSAVTATDAINFIRESGYADRTE